MPLPKRVRELSDEEIQDLKNDLRWLLSEEGGWKFRDLSQALGFAPTANALRNILYDKTGRLGTTRARFDAVRRLRSEKLEPGTVLIESTPATGAPRGRRAKAAAAAAAAAPAAPAVNGRGRTRRSSGRGGAGVALPLSSLALASPALLFKLGGTEFSAEQQPDGGWRVVITATCTSEQMAAWAKQVMDDGLGKPAVTWPAGE